MDFFSDNDDKRRIRSQLESVGGYDRDGNVFGIARPLTGSASFSVKTFPDADALKQFINEFVFFRYWGCCPTWRSVLRVSDCFSDEERGTGTLKGKNYTPEGGKDYVIELIGSGKLVVYRTGSWLQPHERNHHLPWPKSGTKKEEFLPPSQTTTLGPHEEPGYVPPPQSPVELKTSGDMSTMEDESVGSNKEPILFGQKRVSPNFGNDPKFPNTSGKSINEVAENLRNPNHPLTADDLPITAFRDPATNQLVSANTRTRAALAKAGVEPAKVDIIDIEALPKRQRASLLRRLTEQPVLKNSILPSTKIPVTPSTRNLNVLEVIEIK